MIPQSRLQYLAPIALRHRKPASAKLQSLALSGAMIMRLAAKGAYPLPESLSDKQIRNRGGRTPQERAEYRKIYMKNRRMEQKQEKGMRCP